MAKQNAAWNQTGQETGQCGDTAGPHPWGQGWSHTGKPYSPEMSLQVWRKGGLKQPRATVSPVSPSLQAGDILPAPLPRHWDSNLQGSSHKAE